MRTMLLLAALATATAAQAPATTVQRAHMPRQSIGIFGGYNVDAELPTFGFSFNMWALGGPRKNIAIQTPIWGTFNDDASFAQVDAGVAVELMTAPTYGLYAGGGISGLMRSNPVTDEMDFGADVFYAKGGIAYRGLFAEGEIQFADGGSALQIRAGIAVLGN